MVIVYIESKTSNAFQFLTFDNVHIANAFCEKIVGKLFNATIIT